MKNLIITLFAAVSVSWSIPKPMEAITNYNVMMVHGAYGSEKGINANANLKEADSTSEFLGDATLGSYTSDDRITKWIGTNIFEEPDIGKERNPSNAYIYNWRSFTNPANSSLNNAHEMGDRMWNAKTDGNSKFGKRRALFEETQEVKASLKVLKNGKDSLYVGQSALELIRQNPDLYRQLASRYILIGHSMGGVVSREYVQGDFYNGDVDKIITLDSPHEGTGALNMQIYKEARGWTDEKIRSLLMKSTASMAATGVLLAVMGIDPVTVEAGMCITLFSSAIAGGASIPLTRIFSTEVYTKDDSLVHYVDPYQTGFGTIRNLNGLPYDAEKLPMFRILGSKNSMTFGDPTHVDYGPVGSLYLENFSLPVLNMIGQMGGNGDLSTIYVNALTAGIAGIVGIPLIEQGSSLVTEASGLGKHVRLLNDENVDVRKEQFNAAVQAESSDGDFATAMGIASGAILALDFTLGLINPVAAKAAKTGIVVAFSATMGFSVIGGAIATGFDDLAESHMMPLYKKNLEKWFGNTNSFSLVNAGSSEYTPYLMEDFLYERPFVNLALNDSKTIDSLAQNPSAQLNRNCFFEESHKDDIHLCEVGLYGNRDSIVGIDTVVTDKDTSYDTTRAVYYGSFKKADYKAFKQKSIAFKSVTDWDKMGIKLDRWEKVDGLHPDGSKNEKGVPIRHVERYEVPAITVDNWIEKYSFVVDDLMPHRLRQIVLNFNYQQEIAWECDISKDSQADDACAVYKRKSGDNWPTKPDTLVPHPVLKNGQFDFEPRNYGFENLLDIQKDNQNTVTISVVNKIGLSNTQRLYYLFKATEDYLVPIWPKREVVVNAISGFEAYASVLDYQGFDVVGMRDSIWYLKSVGGSKESFGNLQDMDFVRSENSGAIYGSRLSETSLKEGEYHWVFNTITHNAANDVCDEAGTCKVYNDSSDIYDVPFRVDVTAPAFELAVDDTCVNPDSALFVARFSWRDTIVPDIRVMRWQLERDDGNGYSLVESLPSLYNVSSKNFAVAWDKVPERGKLKEGLYRIKVDAIDYAAPNVNAYDYLSNLVTKIASGKESASDWDSINNFDFNHTVKYATFWIDTTAPIITFDAIGSIPLDISAKQKYVGLERPARVDGFDYVSEDSLLQINYSIKELLGGRDSTLAKIDWRFANVTDSAKKDRAGDSVWIKDASNIGHGVWSEMAEMRLQDGDYILQAITRDQAKNTNSYEYRNIIRIDRTAPKIISLTSTRQVYSDPQNFGATIKVSQTDDVATNRTGMRCYYSIYGGKADEKWRSVSDKLLGNDTIEFDIPSEAVGLGDGKRYLEVACFDAAGNVSVSTDLFHVGHRYPVISSPAEEEKILTAEYIPIVGIAPPASVGAENTTVYRLRYRLDGTDEWLTDKISVISENQSKDDASVSKIAQSTEGVLGYLHNVGFSESRVIVELATRSCSACEWITDTKSIFVDEVTPNETVPQVVFDVSSQTMQVGKDSLEVSLRLEGNFNDDYYLRVYAEDSKGVGIFDKSIEKIFSNPFQGEPTDLTSSKAVWFYEKDGLYHLQWNGFSVLDSITVSFDSNTFGESCLAPDGLGSVLKGCAVRDQKPGLAAITSATNAYLMDYPVWQSPSHTDKLMTLWGSDGHVTMRASGAFHVGWGGSATDSDYPVYFGKSSESGFSFMGTDVSSAINPWSTGWTVNPNSYGLNFVWDGITSTNSYPAEGKVVLHAEVVQNTLNNPNAILKDTSVILTLPEMEISLPALPEFYIINNSSDTLASDSDEVKIYDLGSMNIPYGILYRDAKVSIKITDSDGKLVQNLQDTVFTKASTNRVSSSVFWNAMDTANAVDPGTYKVVITAYEVGENGKVKTAETNVKVSLREMVPDSASAVNLVVSEAFDDNGKHRYVPVPDYLVRADIAAKYLSPEKRRGVALNMNVSGTQTIYGYAPERFSLAIRRHRQQLNLVVVRRLHTNIEYVDCGWLWGAFGCSEEGQRTQEKIYIDTLTFSSDVRTGVLNVHKVANDNDEDFGYDDDKYSENYLDMVVFTMAGWKQFLDGEQIDNVKNEKQFENAVNSQYNVWNLSKITSNSRGFVLPPPESGKQNYTYPVDKLNENCSVVFEDSIPTKFCTYGDSGTTAGYDPNANLFVVRMSGIENGDFYALKEKINPSSDRERYRFAYFNIELTIPNEYWDAPFGMDNLVNRTIRFDHTNKTLFGTGTDGYWAELEKEKYKKVVIGSYFDGTGWKHDKSYGLLTPYEVQYLPFLSGNYLWGGKNIFLFADENNEFMYPSYFDMKFYGPKDPNDYFQVLALGTDLENSDFCDYKPTTNINIAYGNVRQCQISMTSLDDSVRTPLFAHGTVTFFVARNALWSENGHPVEVSFPNNSNKWQTEVKKSGKPCAETVKFESGSTDCYKYYEGGSKVHHYLYDFTDDHWLSVYTKNGIIRNIVNSPAQVLYPSRFNFDEISGSQNAALSNFTLKPKHDNYENGRFYIPLDTITKIKNKPTFDDVTITTYEASISDENYGKFNDDSTRLIIEAKDTIVKRRIYRESLDSVRRVPTQMKSVTLPVKNLCKNFDSWMKNPSVETISLEHLDSTEHSHFVVSTEKNGNDRIIKFKDAKDIKVKRPKELIELKAHLKADEKYQLSYLKDGGYYFILDTIVSKSGVHRLAWFDVNRLQGNTQFLLTWGGEANKLFYSSYNLYVGSDVAVDDESTVQSLFGELTVSFPKGSLEKREDVTVRTIENNDYPFEVFNNMPLTGPVMEVLPSMEFKDTANLPRIQMRISKAEMEANGVTPQTLKLYKVDFKNERFVPLQNALYGYLKADGSPAVDNVLPCKEPYSPDCYPGDDSKWEYILISAETKTFSVFAAMSSALADIPNFGIQMMPEIATSSDRIVNVKGAGNYVLYVDDDSLWMDKGDETPAVKLPYTRDEDGLSHVVLPSRSSVIDTNYVFVVALAESDADGEVHEYPVASAVARSLTVPAEFACVVPSDSLWLGLDNGYMAYGASCNHPGYGWVSLYQNGHVVSEIRGEIPDTIIYDGYKTLGTSHVGKIATGVYESRYIGVSALGMDMQMAGPRVYTDSARPSIRNFSVQDSSEVLDRIFTATADVYDSESGIARVVVTPVFGGDTLRVMNVVPDSAGHVSASIRISRKQLAECTGCYLSMEMRVEDYGHNHAEQGYVSDEKLYPYPTELALWYPAREGGGRLVHELLGTGHDFDLFKKMGGPWGSDAGLYFSKSTDYIYGNGTVDFGSTNSYSFEARIKPGNPNDNAWHEILSFKGVNALDIRLLQNKRALMLVEGSHNWKTGSILPVTNKSWSHVVVTVDSDSVKFYVDGESKAARNSGISLEREMEGVFSMGKAGSEPSYIGNIADIRMYSRALTAAEVEELSKPVTDAGEVSDVIVIAVKDMEAVSGFSNEFSCSVAGNKYLVSGDSATLTMSVIVENSADYNVVLYARSATVGDKPVYVGESNLLTGIASVSNTWRAVTVSGVSVHLAAGTHTLMLKVPAGVQIGGAALTTANIPASMIAWGISTSDKVAGIVPADTARKVKSYLRYEGYPETSTLRPRIRLRNVSNEPVNGFSVRYYFRGEDASQAGVDRYWPNYGPTFPAVHSESANTGYVEWSFAETIPVAGTVFGGSGPHFGLYNSDFTPWSASDDPSFVDPNSGLVANIDGFYEDAGIVVLDKGNNLIGGSCAEMEDPVSLETKVRVLAADVRGDKLASEIHFNVENTGNVSLKNFDVRYYFFVEEGLAPDYELNDKSKCSSASMESLGSGRWQVTVHCDSSLAAGKAWQNPVKVALHLPGWAAMWNADDDPSHDSLGMAMRVARGICVFDSTGYMLYGNTPVWALPAPDEVNPDSVYNVDFGYHAPGTVPVIRTPEGLVITMDNWSYVELSLVTALGTPVKSIFNGTLAPGEQFVHVDWTGIDMNRTYLMLKMNGTIKSTKKLSQM